MAEIPVLLRVQRLRLRLPGCDVLRRGTASASLRAGDGRERRRADWQRRAIGRRAFAHPRIIGTGSGFAERRRS